MFATAYAEDLQVCAFVQRALEREGLRAHLTSPTAPRARGDDLVVTSNGRDVPVRALYRFFPTEYMEGQRNLDAIVSAVERGRLRGVSSFAHMFAQSKLAFARAFDLEPARARTHFPESRDLAEIDDATLARDREDWVIKRALGRVGDEVFVGALTGALEWAITVREVRALRNKGEAWIAQRFVRQRAIATPFGDRLITLGAYVLDGRFVGYFARLTQRSHCSHDALCVPVFVDDVESARSVA
jgi:hypothetical protein